MDARLPYHKILSLDGGGPWCLIEVSALGEIFGRHTPGREILRHFDLVVANSGGSMVAGALATNLSPQRILERIFLAETGRRRIFVETRYAFFTRFIRFGPRYRTIAKFQGVCDTLNEFCPGLAQTSLLDLSKKNDLPDFLISAFDYDRQRAVFFRSNTDSVACSDPGRVPSPTLAEALHASSNAPVNYFNKPAIFPGQSFSGRRFWDGGLAGLNNPVLVGVIEAITNGSATGDLKVLSIGTGSVVLPPDDGMGRPFLELKRTSGGLFPGIEKVARAIMEDPPDAATYIAHRVLHGTSENDLRLIRMNPLIEPVRDNSQDQWRVPRGLGGRGSDRSSDEAAFKQLVEMDLDAIEQQEVDLIKRFCDLWISDTVPNQPIQSTDELLCRIGHPRFSAAKEAFEGLMKPPSPGQPLQGVGERLGA